MIYIFETDLPNVKPLKFSLKKVYGLGNKQTSMICKKLGFTNNLTFEHLNDDQIIKLLKLIERSNLKITGELKKFQILKLKSLVDIKCYKGLRRLNGLPVRGQRTHTNAKSSKSAKRF